MTQLIKHNETGDRGTAMVPIAGYSARHTAPSRREPGKDTNYVSGRRHVDPLASSYLKINTLQANTSGPAALFILCSVALEILGHDLK